MQREKWKEEQKRNDGKNQLMTFVDTYYSYNHRYSSSNMMCVATKAEIDDWRKVLMFNTDEDLIIMLFDEEIKDTFHHSLRRIRYKYILSVVVLVRFTGKKVTLSDWNSHYFVIRLSRFLNFQIIVRTITV